MRGNVGLEILLRCNHSHASMIILTRSDKAFLRVPAIGLGCMGMLNFYGSRSEAQIIRVLDRAVDIGCRFWNTADMYGPFTNEILLSKALDGRRDQITLATKFRVSRGKDGSWQGIKGSLAWVLSRDVPVNATPGTRSSERLEENWASLGTCYLSVECRTTQICTLHS